MISLDTIDKVRRTDITTLIAGYTVDIKKSGKLLKCLCPIHNEKTPSFIIYPDTNSWYCWGACGKGGDTIEFIKYTEKLSFFDSVKFLADKIGIEIETNSNIDKERQAGYELLSLVANLYQVAMKIGLRKREPSLIKWRENFTDEQIIEFQIGYAPKGKRRILSALTSRGYTVEQMKEVAIVKDIGDKHNKEVVDTFSNGVVFPIRDINGQVLGFSMKCFWGDKRYINSVTSAYFKKQEMLFNLDLAKRQNELTIVEGYTDVMAIYTFDSGVVATMGVPTLNQIKLIPKSVKKLFLAFDGDKTGREYIKKFLQDLPPNSSITPANIWIIDCFNGNDPRHYIDNGGDWNKAKEKSTGAIDYILEALIKSFGLDAHSKTVIVERMALYLGKLNAVEFDHYVNVVADRLSIRSQSVRAIVTKKGVNVKVEKKSDSTNIRLSTWEYLLCTFIMFPHCVESIKLNPQDVFISQTHIDMFELCYNNGVFLGQNLDKGTQDIYDYYTLLMDEYEHHTSDYDLNDSQFRDDIQQSIKRLTAQKRRLKI